MKRPGKREMGLRTAETRALTLAFAAFALLAQNALAADRIRVAAQKTGTLSWELAVVSAFGLDKESGLELEVSQFASTEAGKIAIQGGGADIVVSDWLWVARERAQGSKLTFYPHSTAIGAVMTKDATINAVTDLAGKKLGVAGGPVDKSWLFLKAFALQKGLDLEKSATVVYGAPPLLAEKAAQGELDAVLEFWNYCVALEARGFRRAIELTQVEKALGAMGDAIVTGYVFNEDFASAHQDALARFFAMTKKAQQLIASSDKAWSIVAARIGASDGATEEIYRKRYVEGIPTRSVSDEEKDAAVLYAALMKIGGKRLVGLGQALDPGTFYKGGGQEEIR